MPRGTGPRTRARPLALTIPQQPLQSLQLAAGTPELRVALEDSNAAPEVRSRLQQIRNRRDPHRAHTRRARALTRGARSLQGDTRCLLPSSCRYFTLWLGGIQFQKASIQLITPVNGPSKNREAYTLPESQAYTRTASPPPPPTGEPSYKHPRELQGHPKESPANRPAGIPPYPDAFTRTVGRTQTA